MWGSGFVSDGGGGPVAVQGEWTGEPVGPNVWATCRQLIPAIRGVIRQVPGADRIVAALCTVHDYGDPGRPRIVWNDDQARTSLVDALVTDAIGLLANLPEQSLADRAADAVGLPAPVATGMRSRPRASTAAPGAGASPGAP